MDVTHVKSSNYKVASEDAFQSSHLGQDKDVSRYRFTVVRKKAQEREGGAYRSTQLEGIWVAIRMPWMV